MRSTGRGLVSAGYVGLILVLVTAAREAARQADYLALLVSLALIVFTLLIGVAVHQHRREICPWCGRESAGGKLCGRCRESRG